MFDCDVSNPGEEGSVLQAGYHPRDIILVKGLSKHPKHVYFPGMKQQQQQQTKQKEKIKNKSKQNKTNKKQY